MSSFNEIIELVKLFSSSLLILISISLKLVIILFQITEIILIGFSIIFKEHIKAI
jgi:hypothetical protein